jgi:K(+)-stimulated pyrophosphate-energized sodium pump
VKRQFQSPPPHPSGAVAPVIDSAVVPKHVAIVMDGNGRWAKERGLARTAGHEAGEAALLDVVQGAIEIGVTHVSAYAFSTENWKRSPDEVRFLMGFNRDVNNQPLSPSHPDYMDEESYRKSRQILADLDAVGNTTKAITKGIAIGSAVLAAVSLFASFIAIAATGKGEDAITRLSIEEFLRGAQRLNLADPYVFIGMLFGGAVPFLFSSMTIRAVGRAAFLIVQECRMQFRDKDIWEGRKRPDYGRVVDICTTTAQKELVGPGLLAIFAPVVIGFSMGPWALGGYLAGMIVVGQLIAVFMTNAGGAWDNAKKTIEDQPKTATTGKGSETHKASVTGDTVGDPLKDTAGPAINPLLKVMNMVSLLILPSVITYNIKDGTDIGARWTIGISVLGVALLAVVWAWWQSKRESDELKRIDEEFAKAAQG